MADPCIPPSIDTPEIRPCIKNPNAQEVEWRTELDEFSPFLDPRNCRFSIVVDWAYVNPSDVSSGIEQHESLGARQRRRRVERYVAYGVDRLLQFYAKRANPEARAALISDGLANFFDESTGVSYVLPYRPGSKAKVLVAVNFELFYNLPDRPYVPNYDPDVSVITAKFDVRLFRAKVKFVSDVIRDYYSTMAGARQTSFGIPVERRGLFRTPEINLQDEAEKMMSFLSYLQKFLDYNQANLNLEAVLDTREEYIEFIIDQNTYTLLDVVYIYQDGSEKYLRAAMPLIKPQVRQTLRTEREREIRAAIGVPNAPETVMYYPSSTNPRTIALIYWTAEELFILFNNHLNPSSKDFIERYIYPPVDTNMAIGNRLKLNQDHLRDVDNGLYKAGMVLNVAFGAAELISGEGNLLPLADQYVKSWADLQFENNTIFDSAFQSNIARQTDDIVRVSDSGVFVDWATAWDRVDGNVEALYRLVLNHVDVRYLLAKLAQCSSNLDPDAFNVDPILLQLLERIAGFLLVLPNMDWSTFNLKPDFYQIGWDITNDLVNYVANFIVNLVMIALTEGILTLLRNLDELCEENFDYDSIDIETLLSDNFNTPQEAASFYAELAGNTGEGGDSNLLRELIRDISVVLSTPELCSLLSGAASAEVLAIVHNIILTQKYSVFHSRFETRNDVVTYFQSLGKLFDPSLCELGIVSGDLCPPGYNEQLRRRILSRKEGVTSEQIDEQIQAEKRRREKILQDFDRILDSAEGGLTQALNDVLNQGDIANQAASHPSTQHSLQQMVQMTFVNPIITLATEGLGNLETRYTTVQYSPAAVGPFGLLSFLTEERFPSNTGIMDVVTSVNGYCFYSFGATLGKPTYAADLSSFNEGPPLKRADGIIEQLPRINLSTNTIPEDGFPSVEIDTLPSSPTFWSYKLNLHTKIGGFSTTRVADRYIMYKNQGVAAPSWWTLSANMATMDNPVIETIFIKRDPVAGFDNREADAQNASSTLRTSDPREFRLIRIPTDKYIRADSALISVFTDYPKILEQAPNNQEFMSAQIGSKQQVVYANQFIKKAARIPPSLASVYTELPMARKIVGSYRVVYNDVIRILYRFVTDSVVNIGTNTSILLPNIRTKLKDSNEMTKLLGLEDIQETVEQGLADALVSNEPLDTKSRDIMGEPALRFMIRIYILEFFMKNLYTFISSPENNGYYGRTVLARGVSGLGELSEQQIPIKNPSPEGMDSLSFFNRTLDLNGVLDSVLVSYIAEYIKFSDNRVVGCSAFYEIAVDLAEKELIESGMEFMSITTGIVNDDTLAYYPAKRTDVTKPDAALKYYVAKELKSFMSTFQEFVELKNISRYSKETEKRSLMEAFLDKFQILGHNMPLNVYRTWEEFGEGLYMDFYVRAALPGRSDESVYLFSSFNDLSVELPFPFQLPITPDGSPVEFSDDYKIGLRICVRDSIFHDNPSPGDDTPEQGRISEILQSAFSTTSATGIDVREGAYSVEKGLPIVEIEIPWGQVKAEAGPFSVGNVPYSRIGAQRRVLDYMKKKMTESTEFRTLFEYCFPVKKLFNFLMINMDQSVSAFLTNTKIRGVKLDNPVVEEEGGGMRINRRQILNPSGIDPEQFKNAKGIAKTILENVLNSDNYRYIPAEAQEAGGITNLVLRNSLEDL